MKHQSFLCGYHSYGSSLIGQHGCPSYCWPDWLTPPPRRCQDKRWWWVRQGLVCVYVHVCTWVCTDRGLEAFRESFSFLRSCLAFSLASAFSSFFASTVWRETRKNEANDTAAELCLTEWKKNKRREDLLCSEYVSSSRYPEHLWMQELRKNTGSAPYKVNTTNPNLMPRSVYVNQSSDHHTFYRGPFLLSHSWATMSYMAKKKFKSPPKYVNYVDCKLKCVI